MKRNLVTFGVVIVILGGIVGLNQFDPARIWDKRVAEEQAAAELAEKGPGEQGENFRAAGIAKAKSVAFLAENAKKEGVVVMESGLQYRVIREGTGAIPVLSSDVKVHYRGALMDGTVFDETYERGKPATMGVARLITGWTEALMMMKTGAKWELCIPPDLGYGFRGHPPRIPSNTALVFEVELIEIVD